MVISFNAVCDNIDYACEFWLTNFCNKSKETTLMAISAFFLQLSLETRFILFYKFVSSTLIKRQYFKAY